MSKDPRVDAYIEKSAAFARPILKTLRGAVHEALPNVEEKVRWGMPSFDVNGQPVCQMAAFKAHCRFILWRERAMANTPEDTFGHIASASELPSHAKIVATVKKHATKRAAEVKEKAVARKAGDAPKRAAKPVPKMPADFSAALAKNKKTLAAFEKMSPSHRREYIEWITGAKQDATRTKRLATAIAQITEGKSQNWKYER